MYRECTLSSVHSDRCTVQCTEDRGWSAVWCRGCQAPGSRGRSGWLTTIRATTVGPGHIWSLDTRHVTRREACEVRGVRAIRTSGVTFKRELKQPLSQALCGVRSKENSLTWIIDDGVSSSDQFMMWKCLCKDEEDYKRMVVELLTRCLMTFPSQSTWT